MSAYELITLLLVLAVAGGFLNYRFLKLPSAIGLTLVALLGSLALIALDRFLPGLGLRGTLAHVLHEVRFEETVLHWMLGFLLFAGALHVELEELITRWRSIVSLATLGVLVSTFVVGVGLKFLTGLFGWEIPLVAGLVFGALISPTDPVAVLAILRKTRVPREIESIVVGESLFNDGVAVVLFLGLLEFVLHPGGGPEFVLWLFVKEALGGIALGILLGFVFFLLLRETDDYQLEVLMTITLVMLVYTLAERFHLSGPLGVVAAGLLIGNHGRKLAMSPRTVEHVDTFWELVDGLLNTILFLLLGLEVLVLERFSPSLLALVALSLPLVLLGRFTSVGVSLKMARPFREIRMMRVGFLSWCGVKGGIAVALALTLPANLQEIFLPLTYANVLFSVLVQGLTLGPLARRLYGAN